MGSVSITRAFSSQEAFVFSLELGGQGDRWLGCRGHRIEFGFDLWRRGVRPGQERSADVTPVFRADLVPRGLVQVLTQGSVIGEDLRAERALLLLGSQR
jgi:hypothetical protein